ncbi:MAG TPA: DUF2268 domain-containing putative Zn-dependent protease [Flavobacteriales bacterium]|nr:DUF2268 domain-containing putative Zn-dependent protease [Flavobacteriales bacterium]
MQNISLNADSLFNQKITNPVFNNYFKNSELSDLAKASFNTPVSTLHLKEMIEGIILHKKEITRIIAESYTKCHGFLENDSVEFYIVPAHADINRTLKKMGGVTGQTVGKKQVIIWINTHVRNWKNVLTYCVAHEFNHTCWIKNNFSPAFKWTVVNYMIMEGKADSFAHLLYPNIEVAWTQNLNESEKQELWTSIKPKLNESDFGLMGEIMLGSKNYPEWGGYTLGFDIVQSAMKNNPSIEISDLLNMDSERILQMSKYTLHD